MLVCAADWSSVTSGTSRELHGVWGSSGSDVFAVGEEATILRYNGTNRSATFILDMDR